MELVDEVIARRAAREPISDDERDGLLSLQQRRLRDVIGYLRAAQQRSGWAAHRTTGGLVLGLGNRASEKLVEGLSPADRHRIRYLTIEAVFDGYALASVMTDVRPAGQGKAFQRAADASRFEGKVTMAGEALLAGPLAASATAIVDGWVASLPEPLVVAGRRAVANGLAAGILAFVHEHGVDHAAFAGLVTREKRIKEPPARHVELPADLVAEVLAAPDDDAPRLVLADWLAAQGDPRGELIHIQCALGRAVVGAQARHHVGAAKDVPFESRVELEAREQKLIKKHEATWLAPFRKHIREWTWRRGFVEHVIADAAAFVDGLEGGLREVPLASAKLTGYMPALEARFQAAWHPTLGRIDFSRNRLSGRTVHVLSAPLFTAAHTIDLWGNPLGDDLRRVDFGATPRLRKLRLSHCEVTVEGVTGLAAQAWWRHLTHLDLSGNSELDDEVIAAIATIPSLRWLDVGGTSITDAGAATLAAAWMPELAMLAISGTQISGIGARKLIDGLPLRALHAFHDLGDATEALIRERFGDPMPREAF
jgi:uncharacterized protein (TIGR02996 family)